MNGVIGDITLENSINTNLVVWVAFLRSSRSSSLNLSLERLTYQVEKSSTNGFTSLAAFTMSYLSIERVISWITRLSLDIIHLSNTLSEFMLVIASMPA